MPSIKGKPKEQISYKCPHDLLLKINAAIEKGEYASRNDIITAALRLFLENRDKTPEQRVKEWLVSEEGNAYLKHLIKEVQEEPPCTESSLSRPGEH